MRPADAHDQLVRGTVESVEIDGLVDRTVAMMITSDQQGLPLLMPGERITRETLSIQQYLVRARQFDTECPGLEVGIAGVEIEGDGSARRHVVTCIRQ